MPDRHESCSARLAISIHCLALAPIVVSSPVDPRNPAIDNAVWDTPPQLHSTKCVQAPPRRARSNHTTARFVHNFHCCLQPGSCTLTLSYTWLDTGDFRVHTASGPADRHCKRLYLPPRDRYLGSIVILVWSNFAFLQALALSLPGPTCSRLSALPDHHPTGRRPPASRLKARDNGQV